MGSENVRHSQVELVGHVDVYVGMAASTKESIFDVVMSRTPLTSGIDIAWREYWLSLRHRHLAWQAGRDLMSLVQSHEFSQLSRFLSIT